MREWEKVWKGIELIAG